MSSRDVSARWKYNDRNRRPQGARLVNFRITATMIARVIIMVMVMVMVGAGAGHAKTGLPVPRFATLRADEVNVRTGPGVRYPVEWVFVRRNMPVEITAEFDTWRKVRDWQGTTGWVHQSMLTGRRSIIVPDGVQALRREAADDAAVIARLEQKVVGRLVECRREWCRIEVSGQNGWMKRSQFWGVYPDERIE